MPQRWLTRWLAMIALLTLVGLLFSLNAFLSSQRPPAPFAIFLTQMLPFLMWALLCPALMRVDQAVRARPRSWLQLIGFHLLGAAFFALLQNLLYATVLLALAPRDTSFATVWQTAFSRILLGVVVYKIIVTTNYALDYYEKYRDESDRAALLETTLAQAQLHALKMQLQPHFLFNTLNSISSLVLEDQRAAVQMIARLGDFLRLTIENNGTQAVSLERELEFLNGYLEIQQVRFRDRLQVALDIAPETLQAQVPNLILQPLVENALKHGIAPRLEAGRIEIAARRHNGCLQVQISNDGPQRNGHAVLIKEGVGIANTRARLHQLYQDDFRLELALAREGGAICTIEIPWSQEAREEEDDD